MVCERESRSTSGMVARYERTPIPRIETYETGRETVIFDGHNPLAWIASGSAIPLDDQA